MRRIPASIVLALVLLSPAALAADTASVSGTFLEDDENPTEAISGIACADPPGASPRACVVAIDEGRFAQSATLRSAQAGLVIEAGESIELIPDDFGQAAPIGEPPRTSCSAPEKKPKEHDSEAIAWIDGRYILVGSHGCGRSNNAARLSSFLLARLDPASGKVELSYRLNPVLQHDPVLSAHFGQDLSAGGISIEGAAGVGPDLYFGLRSPAGASQAYLLAVDAASLFAEGALFSRLKTVDLAGAGPADMGIRDLTVATDDILLILAGPATGEAGPYAIAAYHVADAVLGPFTPVDAPDGQKAEAILVLDQTAGAARVLVLHDGVVNGGPLIVSVPLR